MASSAAADALLSRSVVDVRQDIDDAGDAPGAGQVEPGPLPEAAGRDGVAITWPPGGWAAAAGRDWR